MTEQKQFNRWLLVVGAILIQFCLGAIYAWSVFTRPLSDTLDIPITQASLPFSFVLFFFALAVAFGGRLQDQFGPRIVSVIGGILLGAGMILASFATTTLGLVLSYGVLSGIGVGLAYICPIAVLVKWFPDKRGLITGLAVAGFGAGAMVVGPLANALINMEPIGVQNTFRILAVIYVICVTIGGLILRNPPQGYAPQGWTAPVPVAGSAAASDFSVGGMLRTKQFWGIWILYLAGAGSGLMIIGQTSPIAQGVAGMTPTTAALGVSILALFNAFGRIFWGKVSDSLGRTKTLFIMYLLNGLAILSLLLLGPTTTVFFWVGIAVVGATFGGYLALYPAVTADFYGTGSIGLKYGLVFLAYGFGGLLTNIFAPQALEALGSYDMAFVVTGLLCLIAAVVILLLKPPVAKTNETADRSAA